MILRWWCARDGRKWPLEYEWGRKPWHPQMVTQELIDLAPYFRQTLPWPTVYGRRTMPYGYRLLWRTDNWFWPFAIAYDFLDIQLRWNKVCLIRFLHRHGWAAWDEASYPSWRWIGRQGR